MSGLDLNSSKYKLARGKIYQAIKRDLQERGAWVEPHRDRVERYMGLWDAAQMLDYDIKSRGVQIETDRGPKKNDSVALLNATNKQMEVMLEKLQISIPGPVKDGGADV